MRTFDPTLLWRSTVGFDRLFDVIDSSPSPTSDDHCPPYNSERAGEDIYRISPRLPDSRPERSP
jgi:molecular chaperone IbpA